MKRREPGRYRHVTRFTAVNISRQLDEDIFAEHATLSRIGEANFLSPPPYVPIFPDFSHPNVLARALRNGLRIGVGLIRPAAWERVQCRVRSPSTSRSGKR